MRRRVLQRHICGYSVCLCPIKRTPGLYGLIPTVLAQSRLEKTCCRRSANREDTRQTTKTSETLDFLCRNFRYFTTNSDTVRKNTGSDRKHVIKRICHNVIHLLIIIYYTFISFIWNIVIMSLVMRKPAFCI